MKSVEALGINAQLSNDGKHVTLSGLSADGTRFAFDVPLSVDSPRKRSSSIALVVRPKRRRPAKRTNRVHSRRKSDPAASSQGIFGELAGRIGRRWFHGGVWWRHSRRSSRQR